MAGTQLGSTCILWELLGPTWADMYEGHYGVDVFQGPPGVGVPMVLALWERWYLHPSSFLARESRYHNLIQGRGIAQRFLGHLTENGSRVIVNLLGNYMLESVYARPTSINDLVACRTVLQKLRNLGIAAWHDHSRQLSHTRRW